MSKCVIKCLLCFAVKLLICLSTVTLQAGVAYSIGPMVQTASLYALDAPRITCTRDLGSRLGEYIIYY